MSEEIGAVLERKGLSFQIFLEWPGSWAGFEQVWVVGGDGTLNWFINQYPDIKLPLAVFPGGSGNDFQWMLYGDLSLADQVDLVLGATPRAVDAGSCNGRLFLNGVGIGFDGAIVHDLLGKRKMAGKASYLLSILKHIMGYREKKCTLATDNETITENCLMISVANGSRYGGGFHVAPHARADDALLDVNLVGAISPMKRMRYLPVIEKGEHLSLPFVRYSQTARITVTSGSPQHAHLDGEYIFTDRFEIDVLPSRFLFKY